ncbi:hypothetical protein GGF46_004656, partial [Coemansia sp. RSA 552]
RRRDPDRAMALLRRIAAQVRPVMEKRGWRVKVLREFFPRSPNLLGLNVNHGLEIRIRLRSAHDDTQFLEYEDLVGTMLHELVHIVRGPHDTVFYQLLGTLKEETELLMARGYTGDGFFSDGQRVGQGVSHNVPWHQLRAKTLRAVEQRQCAQRLGGPPRTLGEGKLASLQAQHSPAQMAAMALGWRLRDDKWCGKSLEDTAEDHPGSTSDDSDVVVVSYDPARNEPIVISDSEPESSDTEVVLA